jgi:hypothetical protein
MSFKFHGFTRAPLRHATRHTALLLLAFNDLWKQERAKHEFTGGFDPANHFRPTNLLSTLSKAIAPAIKKVLGDEDVYAHLLFLSERKINAKVSMVRNHPGAETKGHPIFQMGKAGEELADIIEHRGLRRFIEGDAKHWQPILVWARLVEAGESCPESWTPENLMSLTALNKGQVNKAIRMLGRGFDTTTKGGDTMPFPTDMVENVGTRRFPVYQLAAIHRQSAVPEANLDDLEEPGPAVEPDVEPVTEPSAIFFDEDGEEEEVTVAPDELVAVIDEQFGTEADRVKTHANVTEAEVTVLRDEAERRRISLDSLITLIIKTGVEQIVEDLRIRAAAAAEIAAEEAAIEAVEEEARRLADDVRGRRASLMLRKARAAGVLAPA